MTKPLEAFSLYSYTTLKLKYEMDLLIKKHFDENE